MRFVDRCRVKVIAGNGGNGVVAFRREKFIFQSRPGAWVLGYLVTPTAAEAPLATVVCVPGHGRGVDDIVGIGQKSGIYWALNPNNGKIAWSTIVGPGGTTGGMFERPAATGEQLALLALSLVFVGLCVHSFVAARRGRTA